MRGRYTEYKDIYKDCEKTVIKLGRDLMVRADGFYNSNVLGVKVSDIVYTPNLMLIEDVVLNTIVDIERIKKYHPIDNPTRYKYAAHIGFWWQRVKPFLCKVDDYKALREMSQKLTPLGIAQEDLFPFILEICKSINEIFMCDFIIEMIKIPPNQTTCDADRDKMVEYEDMKDSLEYFLRYRHYDARGLELFLKGLNTCPASISVTPAAPRRAENRDNLTLKNVRRKL
jgi:hypothetical protein